MSELSSSSSSVTTTLSSSSSLPSHKEALKRHFESSGSKQPLEIIESWQKKQCIQLNSLNSALPLLDRVKIRRHDYYQTTSELLRDRLLERIASFSVQRRKTSARRLGDMLEAAFPMVNRPNLRPVVMELVSHLPKIAELAKNHPAAKNKDKYLKAIVASEELYSHAPVSVKRFIWEDDPSLYAVEVNPLLDEFVSDRNHILDKAEPPLLSLSSKVRRQHPVIVKLMEMIGVSTFLYERTLQLLRDKFVSTRSLALCSLRMELLMALHDAKVDDVCIRDPIHKFAWVLDACGREQKADQKKLSELKTYFKTAKSSANPGSLVELSLLCACPHNQTTLFMCLLWRMDDLILEHSLPRTDSTTIFLLRLIQLGLDAWDLARQPSKKPSNVDLILLTQLFPTVIRFRLEKQISHISKQIGRLKLESRTCPLPLICSGSKVCRLLTRFHCLFLLSDAKFHLDRYKTLPDIDEILWYQLAELIEALAPLDEDFESFIVQSLVSDLCEVVETRCSLCEPLSNCIQLLVTKILFPRVNKSVLHAALLVRLSVHLTNAVTDEIGSGITAAAEQFGLETSITSHRLARLHSRAVSEQMDTSGVSDVHNVTTG